MLDVAKRRWSRRDAARDRHSDARSCRRSSSRPTSARACRRRRPRSRASARHADRRRRRRSGGRGASAWASRDPGAVSATIGTSGVVFASTDRPALDPQGPAAHVLSRDSRTMARHGRHAGGGVVAAMAARSVRAAGRRLRRAHRGSRGVPPGSDGVLWAPYLMGERTPHLDLVGPRGAGRAGGEPHARPRVARRPRRRRVQPAGHVHDLRRNARAGRPRSASAAAARDPPLWREIQADGLRPPGRDRDRGGRRRLRRRPAGRRRRRLLEGRRRGV